MKNRRIASILGILALWLGLMVGSSSVHADGAKQPDYPPPPIPNLTAPGASPSAIKLAKVIGWPEGKTPIAPDGFVVEPFFQAMEAPRWLRVLENGDVLVSQSRTSIPDPLPSWMVPILDSLKATGGWGVSPNQITLLRDQDKDGQVDSAHVLLEGLNQPFGMELVGDWLYIANTDGLMRYPFKLGQTRIEDEGQLILGLPAQRPNNHWTRTVVLSPDGHKLYVSVGSGTNVDEEKVDQRDPRRATILEVNPDGTGLRVYASGLRNAVGLAFHPSTQVLFATVNERDQLGDDLVPDYFTSIRREAFYGWPYAYFGQNEDPRKAGERPDLVAKAVVPDVALGGHVAALGLAFYDADLFPDDYQGGAFIAQHGSANRASFSGYNVLYVPFTDGRPGAPKEFLTGFIADGEASEVYGRPAGVAVHVDGSLLIADDGGKTIWRVRLDRP